MEENIVTKEENIVNKEENQQKENQENIVADIIQEDKKQQEPSDQQQSTQLAPQIPVQLLHQENISDSSPKIQQQIDNAPQPEESQQIHPPKGNQAKVTFKEQKENNTTSPSQQEQIIQTKLQQQQQQQQLKGSSNAGVKENSPKPDEKMLKANDNILQQQNAAKQKASKTPTQQTKQQQQIINYQQQQQQHQQQQNGNPHQQQQQQQQQFQQQGQLPQSPMQHIPIIDNNQFILQQQQYEQRKTVTSQQDNPYLRESLLDKNIMESIEKEMPCESENGFDFMFSDGPHNSCKDQYQQSDRDSFFCMKTIFNEEEEILKRFSELAKDNQSSMKLFDIFEAFIFELSMRNEEKSRLLDKILKHDDKQFKLLKMMDGRVKKLERDLLQLRKVSEIKNLRQSGRYKSFPHPPLANEGVLAIPNPNPSNNSNSNSNSHQPQPQQQQQQLNQYQQFQLQQQQQQQHQHQQQQYQQLLDESSMYDWVVDIDLITNICNEGWTVTLSDRFHKEHKHLFSVKSTETQIPVSEDKSFDGEFTMPNGNKPLIGESGWNGATVAVVGLYDKGKTYVLNNLTQSNLPSGKKINTKGISFKHVNMDSGTNLILLDTAGWYSPVKIQSELSIVEKEATEMFILDLVFEISDYFICVVNDFTSLDQRYLDKLSRNLQNSPNKTFREIIVIHNLKEVECQEILDHVWENQVTQIYQTGGVIQKTQVAAIVPHTSQQQLMEKHVVWFKTQYTRHICLVNDDCELGQNLNPWVFSLLRYWLKAVFVPINRPFSVVDAIMNYSAMKLSSYFKTGLSLHLHDTSNHLIKKIKTKAQMKEIIRLPQVSIDSSGLIMTRPDSFVPAVDIIANDKYQIYMDVPGMSKEDIVLYRQNIITVVKGTKKKPYSEYKKLEKNERKYGDFTLSFKIPEIYERKWKTYDVEHGVLVIMYEKDVDDLHENGEQATTQQQQQTQQQLQLKEEVKKE